MWVSPQDDEEAIQSGTIAILYFCLSNRAEFEVTDDLWSNLIRDIHLGIPLLYLIIFKYEVAHI